MFDVLKYTSSSPLLRLRLDIPNVRELNSGFTDTHEINQVSRILAEMKTSYPSWSIEIRNK